MYRKAIPLCIAVFLSFIAIAGSDNAPMVGTALMVNGDVKMLRGGHKEAITPGMNVAGGDILQTGKNSKVSIGLLGGHVLSLGPESQLEIDEPGAEKGDLNSAMLYVGIVYVRKRPSGANAPLSFQLQTPSAVAGVRGTEFTVAVAPDNSVRVGVEEGSVELETDQNRKIKLGLREGLIIDPTGKMPSKASEYLPERDKIDEWLESKKQAVLKNPLPAAARFTLSMAKSITMAENLLREVLDTTEKIISAAQSAEAARVRGKTPIYDMYAKQVRALLPGLVLKIRMLVRLDNKIQGRSELLKWLVQQATAPGSPTPKNMAEALKKRDADFQALKSRADKLHAERKKFLLERVPVLKDVVKYLW